ncbi:MAG: hypothetical protein AB4050_19955 [Synechococcus sp.]
MSLFFALRPNSLAMANWDGGARARFTPHTALDLPNIAPNAPARESIEVRCYSIVPSNR